MRDVEWRRVPLWSLVTTNDEVLAETTAPDLEFDYVDISAVTQGSLSDRLERVRFGDAPSRARRLARPGDVVMSTVRTYLRAVAPVRHDEFPRVYSTGFAVLRPRRDRVDSRFLGYRLVADDFMDQVEAQAVGVSYPAITAQQLAHVRLTVPSVERQRRIADYLDRETAIIDALIEKQRKLLAVLRERRSQGIREAVFGSVTGGPADSLPPKWRRVKLRHVATMHSGHTPSRSVPEYWIDTTIPWFTLADVWQLRPGTQKYLGETKSMISDLGLANSAAELLPAGTVVLSRTASVGFTGIMPAPMATSQDYWNWVCGPDLLPEFLWNVFRAMRPEFDGLKAGSTHQTVYQADAAALEIPLPPLDEQRAIADRLDRETATIDTLIAKAERFIELAQERRAALITAAVTGQIEIPAEESAA